MTYALWNLFRHHTLLIAREWIIKQNNCEVAVLNVLLNSFLRTQQFHQLLLETDASKSYL